MTKEKNEERRELEVRDLQDDVPPTVGAKPEASTDRRSADDKIDNSDCKKPYLSVLSIIANSPSTAHEAQDG